MVGPLRCPLRRRNHHFYGNACLRCSEKGVAASVRVEALLSRRAELAETACVMAVDSLCLPSREAGSHYAKHHDQLPHELMQADPDQAPFF